MEKQKSLQENNIGKNVINLFQKMKKKSKVNLGGGNCGMVAYAISKYLNQKYDMDISIGVITNADSEEELVNGEFSVYHMFPIVNNKMYDEMGEINTDYLLDLAHDQYDDYNPSMFTFFLPQEESDVVKIILRQTNYDTNWKYFFDLL
jgi:hypothetical protein